MRTLSIAFGLAVFFVAGGARAEGRRTWSLEDAVASFRSRGYDLLLATAEVRRAESDVSSAAAIPNPALAAGYGRTLGYTPSAADCPGCSANSYSVGLSDQAALTTLLWGKRGLRRDVAERVLALARTHRADTQRLLEIQVKQQYVQAALSRAALEFSRQVQASAVRTLELQRLRYPKVIDEGTLARFETNKLQADQDVDFALMGQEQAQATLEFLVGASPGTIEADPDSLKFSVPAKLVGTGGTGNNASRAGADALVELARKSRPDVRSAAFTEEWAQESLRLARRERVPDLALSVQYAQTGTGQNALQPPTVSVGVTAPLPLFYQNQGPIERAQAELYASSVLQRRVSAQLASEVRSAYDTFVLSKGLVERMESIYLDRAKRARDVTELQYNAGSANLIDFLDAQRTFVATKQQYLQNLATYWTSIFQLEGVVGADLR